MKNTDLQSKNLSKFFQLVNLVIIIADLIYVVRYGIVLEDLTEGVFLVGFHLVLLLPSILFQMIPHIRCNFVFEILGFTWSILLIYAFIQNLIYYSEAEDIASIVIYLAALYMFTGPGALISVSLILAMLFCSKDTKQVILFDQEYLDQEKFIITQRK